MGGIEALFERSFQYIDFDETDQRSGAAYTAFDMMFCRPMHPLVGYCFGRALRGVAAERELERLVSRAGGELRGAVLRRRGQPQAFDANAIVDRAFAGVQQRDR